MSGRLAGLMALIAGNPEADRVVPPSGQTANLTVFAAFSMAFLSVFALALSLAADRLADRWSAELARTATVRISSASAARDRDVAAALAVLQSTPGVASARELTRDEQEALLEPWFGPDLPLDTLPVPRMIEIIEDSPGFDVDGLRLRLAGEVPAAVLDDHTRWRRPLVEAAARLRLLATASLILIAASTGAIIALAAQAALAANAQVIEVLRLLGARDAYIARAFVRRFTIRAFVGAASGAILGMAGVLALPEVQEEGAFLTGLGFQGLHWIWPALIPFFGAVVSFWATRQTALSRLRRLT